MMIRLVASLLGWSHPALALEDRSSIGEAQTAFRDAPGFGS